MDNKEKREQMLKEIKGLVLVGFPKKNPSSSERKHNETVSEHQAMKSQSQIGGDFFYLGDGSQ